MDDEYFDGEGYILHPAAVRINVTD
jgi:hypothetical protein